VAITRCSTREMLPKAVAMAVAAAAVTWGVANLTVTPLC